MRKFIFGLVILSLCLVGANILAVTNFKIVEEKDVSIKALDRPFSSYSMQELNKIPVNKRMRYKILVEAGLGKEEYTKLFNNFISSIITKDKDIDEIALFVYDNKDAVDYEFNVASVRWCPKDGWDKVTSYIASSNDRNNYAISIEWSNEYENKLSGLIKYIEKERKATINSGVPEEFQNKITFDENTGTLIIIDYLTDGLGKNTKWTEECKERWVLVCAATMLDSYAMQFPEVQKYDYRCIWKNKNVFVLKTERKELDSLDMHSFYEDFEDEVNRREEKRGRYLDADARGELYLELYVRRIFAHFKNKKLNI